MPILPAEMANSLLQDMIQLIASGQFDEDTLLRLAGACWDRVKLNRQIKAAAMRAQLKVGDRVCFGPTAWPVVLRGAYARVVGGHGGRQGDKVVVDIIPGQIRLIGSRWERSRSVPCPADILELAPEGPITEVSRPKGALVGRAEIGIDDSGSDLEGLLGGRSK